MAEIIHQPAKLPVTAGTDDELVLPVVVQSDGVPVDISAWTFEAESATAAVVDGPAGRFDVTMDTTKGHRRWWVRRASPDPRMLLADRIAAHDGGVASPSGAQEITLEISEVGAVAVTLGAIPGPEGPQGEQGIQGPAGEDGQDGIGVPDPTGQDADLVPVTDGAGAYSLEEKGAAGADAGVLADRPAAAADNVRSLYFATDLNGGTLQRSNGSSWVDVAPGVSELPSDAARSLATVPDAGAGVTLTPNAAHSHDLTLTQNATVTLADGLDTGYAWEMAVLVRQDATGGHTLTWDTVQWDTPPTMPVDPQHALAVRLRTFDGGTTWLGEAIIVDADFAPPPFWRENLDNVAVWVEADEITGLADTDPVAQWDDVSGNARHLTQATAGNRPVYRTGIVNGLPVVRFDGTDDSLGPIDFGAEITQPTTVIAVCKMTNDVNDTRDLFVGANNTSATSHVVRQSSSADGWIVTSGSTLVAAANYVADWQVVVVVFNGASSKVRVNGVETTGNAGARAVRTLALSAAANAWDGDVAVWALIGDALTPEEITGVEATAADKYGVAL